MAKKKESLYNKVYNDLIAKIQSGKYKVGDKLPTEMELTKIYGVSRITVAHALKNLADANLIYRVKRSGTFINGKLNRSAPLIVPIILPFVEDLNEIMTGIQNTALSFNAFTPFYNSKNNLERERNILSEILSNKPDGIIVYPCDSLDNIGLYAEFLARDIPVVCLDRPIEGLGNAPRHHEERRLHVPHYRPFNAARAQTDRIFFDQRQNGVSRSRTL